MLNIVHAISSVVILLTGVQLLLYLVKYYTKIGIGRPGYLSLRYVTIPLSTGLGLTIGLIGVRFHRPTITSPTWMTIVVKRSEISVTEDFIASSYKRETAQSKSQASKDGKGLKDVVEKIKSYASHGILRWVDIVLSDTTLRFQNAGTVQLSRLSLRLAYRRARHRRQDTNLERDISAMINNKTTLDQRGIELFASVANLRLQLPRQDASELMDTANLNMWSDYGGEYGFENVGLSCKIGGIDFVGDDVQDFVNCLQQSMPSNGSDAVHVSKKSEYRTTSQSSEDNLSSSAGILGIFTELQLHAGFFRASCQMASVAPGGKPVKFTVSSKDVVFDVNRLEPTSPEFRMIFEHGVIAHQALFSLIALTIHMDANNQKEPVLSIPMLTTAIKTSTLEHILNGALLDVAHRNRNLTTINTVVTSPASDIHAAQIPVLIALLGSKVKRGNVDESPSKGLTSSMVPKLKFAISVHDPSVRVVLGASKTQHLPPMIIGVFSSVFAEFNALHVTNELKLTSSARICQGRVYYHSPENEEFDVLQTNTASIDLSCSILPISRGYLTVMSDGFVIHLSRPEIVDCFAKITDSLQAPAILPTKLPKPRKGIGEVLPLMRIPEWLEKARLSTKNVSVSISGPDLEVSPDSRGLKLALKETLLDYAKKAAIDNHTTPINFGDGHDLNAFKSNDLTPNSHSLERKVLVSLNDLTLCTVDSFATVDRKYPIIVLPSLELSFSQCNNTKSTLHHLALQATDLALGFSIYKVYAALQALQVLRVAFYRAKPSQANESEHTAANLDAGPDKPASLNITFEAKVNLARLKTTLPLGECQMLDLDHLHVYKRTSGDPQLRLRYARIYVQSPVFKGSWDRILSIRDIHVSRETHTFSTAEKVQTGKSLVVRTDALRIRIPHQFIFYKVVEALINSVKASTQIVHRFVTQTNEYVIAQHPKSPKVLPRIRVKSRIASVEVEDDPFESRLGLIYRVGLSEQRMREAREHAYDRKVLKLRQQQISKSNGSTARLANSLRQDTHSIKSNVTKDDSVRDSEFSSTYSTHSAVDENEFAAERDKLLAHSSRAWILRMQLALSFRNRTMKELRQQKWGKDEISHGTGLFEDILGISNRPPLFSMTFSGLDVVLDKPSFALEHLPDFVHRVGRGMPKDTQYGLLIPISLNWKMDEARIQLRDYPLPLLHVPALHGSQRIGPCAWEFTTDLVIGEEFPEPEAIRHIDVNVIPVDTGRQGYPGFAVEVQRTATSVKTYAEISIDLNSALPTRVHWGSSMQPSVADCMRILETLTKPQQDPSPKLGFWDKLGLVMHTSMKLSWKQDGDMHVTLKGSRDPYVVMGTGAGLTKVFRGNVRWNIGVDTDSRKLMEVMCDEYMLAISDFSRREAGIVTPHKKVEHDQQKSKTSLHHYHLSRKELSFQKILMKLTGDVRWTAGLAFERHCEDSGCSGCEGNKNCRIWDFAPHWHVKMRIPKHSVLPGGKIRDAFQGFRSHYIHGQISVTSRARQDCMESYNTMHLTPKFFAHFFDWIHSFSGNLSLPIRAGPLFPSTEGPKQKFGQHLMTVKYNLQLEPLYLSHVYKSTSAADPAKIDITGVKARIDSFTLDLHQRKEERVVTNKQLETERKSQHMAIYRAQVDLKNTDLRAVTAVFKLDTSEDLHRENTTRDPLNPPHNQDGQETVVNGSFDVSEEDLSWIDLDDFVELDTIVPEISPTCQIIPLAYSPQFLYDRDTTHKEGSQDEKKLGNVSIPGQRFGSEKTHFCSMVHLDGNDFGMVQRELWKTRRSNIEVELRNNQERLGQVEAQLAKTPNSFALNEERKTLSDHHSLLLGKLRFIEQMTSSRGQIFVSELDDEEAAKYGGSSGQKESADVFIKKLKEEVRTFNNRFFVHNIQMKWNNTLRNILIRYIQQVNQRRGFSYYMSQKAVRFLSDLVAEQMKHKDLQQKQHKEAPKVNGHGQEMMDDEQEPDSEIEQLIKQLLDDREAHFYVQDESSHSKDDNSQARRKFGPGVQKSHRGYPADYAAVDNYILRLIAPQIQLQSEKNKESAVILAAQSMQMKILAINDTSIAEDDVSALVQRKFSVKMNSAQFFHAHQSGFHGAIANLLTQNSYGADGNSYWPPWVPIENVYDFENSPRSFDRIVVRTSAELTYIKNNNLRIKKHERVHTENRISDEDIEDLTDSVTVNFPKFNLSANSEQYYAMFTIAMDLLIYSEPLQKERNEQIERILLAADFSDLSGAPEMVSTLQTRIRHLSDFKTQFKLHAQRNDPQSKRDELRVEKELEHCEDELFFLMKSIATAQQKREDRDNEVIAAMHWRLKADEILWHLMEKERAFIDFGLSKASFSRTDNSDSSNFNTLEIEMMQGINLSPDPVFAQLFAPYFGTDRTVVDVRRSKMVRVYWYMLEAIGGISVCDHFEVNLFPLRLQMEHDVGKKLFDYVFPDKKEDKIDEINTESESDDNGNSIVSSSSDDIQSEHHPTPPEKEKLSSKLSFDRLRHSASLSKLTHRSSASRLRHEAASFHSRDSDGQNSIHSRRTGPSAAQSSSSLPLASNGNVAKASPANSKKKATGSADDLTAMMTRASTNMSLVYVKVPSVVLALSYKGAKAKNFVDVTDFVFKIPTIEYRNKTWSYLDLAEHLKREVIKAVLAHTGSLLKDKMTHYRRSKGRKPTIAKQLTSYQTFVPAEAFENDVAEGQEVPGRASVDHERARNKFILQNRTSSAETTSLHEEGNHGLFNNAIGRHIQHLSHLARSKDGLAEDNAESTLKKTRLLLGKFIDKAK